MGSDEDLVRRIREGDTAAFDELYRRYSRRLFGYIRRLVTDRALAEDLLQEVLLTVLREDAVALRPGQFGGWLFTVARNRCVSALRDGHRRETKLREASQWPPPGAPAPSPEQLTGQGEQLAALRAALATLSPSHQDVLLLKEVGNLTYREIADLQQVPEGTAKSRLHFAIRALRRALGE